MGQLCFELCGLRLFGHRVERQLFRCFGQIFELMGNFVLSGVSFDFLNVSLNNDLFAVLDRSLSRWGHDGGFGVLNNFLDVWLNDLFFDVFGFTLSDGFDNGLFNSFDFFLNDGLNDGLFYMSDFSLVNWGD